MLLTKKLVRELWRQKGQALAVLSVTFLGVLLFVASGAAYVDLDGSYRETRERLALADLHVAVTTATDRDVERLRTLPSVAAADGRAVVELPVEIPGATPPPRLALRVVSLPDAGAPAIDKLLVVEGDLPSGPGQLVLEKHFAEHHGIHPGDHVDVLDGASRRPIVVSGVAVSAEYLWVARDEHDVMPSPDAFGVAWSRRDALRELARGLAGAVTPGTSDAAALSLDGLALAAGDGANEVLLLRAEGATDDDVMRDVRATLGDGAVRGAVAAKDLPGVRLLQMDVDGYKGMAAFFPFFFLGVGAFIVASILGRVVDAQRAIIGTFAALGVSRARILAHYLAYATILGTLGAALGAASGFAVSPAITRQYAAELGIPFVRATLHWDLAAIGVGLGALVSLLSGSIPALHASRLVPAEAMRPPRPSTSSLAAIARRLGGAPLPLRMAVRDVLGRPLRSAGTALGVAAALVLVLTTSALLESMRTTFSSIFDGSRRYALRVDLSRPEARDDAEQRFVSVGGVERAEGLLVLPAEISFRGASERAELDGVAPDATLYRPMDVDGTPRPPKPHGIVLTRALAKSIGAAIGDDVDVSVPALGRTASLHLDGFADAALGKTAVANRDEIAAALGVDGLVTSVALTVRDGDLAAARAEVTGMDGVFHVEDLASLRAQMKEMMALGWVMVGVMLFFSVVLAAAILFNTATLGILERRRELATLRALGRTLRELALGLTLEHGILCAAGLALGLPLAVVAIKRLLALYSSDLFSFPFVLSPSTIAVACGGIGLVLLAAQWPALRSISKSSIADAVRDRE